MFDKKRTDQRNALRASIDVRAFLRTTRVAEIMVTKVVSIKVDARFSEVPKKMKQSSVRHLPVVDANNKFVGLITQRDLYKIHSPRKLEDGSWYYDDEALNEFVLENVMLKNPGTLRPEDPVGDAIVFMVRGKYGCIPIVDKDQKLCGILTRSDILKMAARIYDSKLFS